MVAKNELSDLPPPRRSRRDAMNDAVAANDLEERAWQWIEADPDEDTRAELTTLLADPVRLAGCFGSRLRFGTAGIRGPLGPGPGQMNRVLARMVAAALVDRVLAEVVLANDVPAEDGGWPEATAARVVIGFDARHKSRAMAEDMARVMAARGVEVILMTEPSPTPVLAFAVTHLSAAAGVMITASHNPAGDNGIKVYWSDGLQIVPPLDREIESLLAALDPLDENDLAEITSDAIAPDTGELRDAYLAAMVTTLSAGGARAVNVAYTPLHGVGRHLLVEAFRRSGFPSPHVVASQADPDPDFPTVPFPNPEEPGALGELLVLADQVGADVAIANDPDADRLAVALPTPAGWRVLTGDELGWLLADHVLRRGSGDDRLVARSVVSSRLLDRLAEIHGVDHVETLTGFKWLMRPALDPARRLVFAYEEALGYAVTDRVRDKDGISAALAVADMTAELVASGQTLAHRFDELRRSIGVASTAQRSIQFEASSGLDLRAEAMAALRADPPTHLAGHPVTRVVDLSTGGGELPPADVLVCELEDGRIVARPSGTEPKLKVYGEIVAPHGGDVGRSEFETRRAVAEVIDAAVRRIAAPQGRPVRPVVDAGELEARAAALMDAGADGGVADLWTIVRCIDLTTLEGDDTRGRIRALCATARRPHPGDATVEPVAAVCVYPALIGLVAELLEGSGVRSASVAGAFPAGLSTAEIRLADIEAAVAHGADEVDIVLDRSAFLDGDRARARSALEAARVAIGDRHMKVILEVGELGSYDTIHAAAMMAMEAGADFVKTSTGKIASAATPGAVLCMADAVAEYRQSSGRMVGLKVAGGVRTAGDALGYLHLVRSTLGDEWAGPDLFRIGASSLLTDVITTLDRLRLGID